MDFIKEYINLSDYTVTQQVLFFLDAIFWAVTYILVIYNAIKYKFFGIPIEAAVANVAWELLFSTVFTTNLGVLFVWGIRLWLITDAVMLFYLHKYGRKQVRVPFIFKNFNWVTSVGFVLWGLVIYGFVMQYGDPIGAGTGYILNIIMSTLFIFLILAHPEEKALSFSIAMWKGFGTVFVGVGIFLGEESSQFVVIIAAITFALDMFYGWLTLNKEKIIEWKKEEIKSKVKIEVEEEVGV
ncbi:transmembrane-type terpene cyclase [Flammeovirga kamogawensis]|uniref:Transporter n=1 Tax=Flammeovirga kamogawensis TaxID=373891 RepID=A0ABX8GWB2_9BACT|nr:hypothetical protein [Flammeovirga kamogawensis]MBB6461117.1 hypothetical protein [Flammeovirga kamogawensis]QWG07683.1 hypothetical protein KM029_01735 [Flammeovirga kamogawensis]TRX69492.1 hypothetical protein EO216_15675 [Flammeovirga kamogawensis]